MAPDRIRLRGFLGHSLLELRQPDAALREYALMPAGDYRRLLGQAVVAARAGHRGQAELELQAMQDRYGDAANWQYGEIYAQLGMPNRAFEAFEAAWKVRDPGLGYLRVDPLVDPVRKDPRFAVLEARLNFPER
jgi:hypothetical protein